ncbi:nuclear factor of activated T-cells 5-like [Watersipora subatra]|uniref:nuclear factor of activated T-cells 5-like n=1 Tax=Watersipora subatra TaxID=2589382 RepID=UPI00355B57D5
MQSSINNNSVPSTTVVDAITNGCHVETTAVCDSAVHDPLPMKIDRDVLKSECYYPRSNVQQSTDELQQLMSFLDEEQKRRHNDEEFSTAASIYSPATTVANGITAMSAYRNNPPDLIDETSMLPFAGVIPMRTDELSISTEDTVSYVSCQNSPTSSRQVMSELDTSTISALLEPSQRINLSDNSGYDIHSREIYDGLPRKMSRVDSGDGSELTVDKVYSADLNQSPVKEQFTFQKFGMDVTPEHVSTPQPANHSNFSGIGDQCSPHSHGISPGAGNQSVLPSSESMNGQLFDQMSYTDSPLQQVPRDIRRKIIPKTPPLTQPFSDSYNNIMLKILKQPEAQHRARYMTEGSRGAVKDSQQQGYPMIQLLGWTAEARLEIFIGADSGKVKPHGFYQACRISGKNASSSRATQVNGTTVIEMEFDKTKNMTATIDCIGILKLRNTDVERRTGLVKHKKKSTKCRLIFRVNLCQANGTLITLQTASNIIACTQPAGQPEINRMSLDCAPISGGQDLFIIGKNFNKGFKVKFQQPEDNDPDSFVWEQEAEIEQEYNHLTHFICKIPAYTHHTQYGPIAVQVVVKACGGISEPVPFTYQSEQASETVSAMTTSCTVVPKSQSDEQMSCNSIVGQRSEEMVASATNHSATVPTQSSPPSIVSPEALELAAQIQQQASTDPSMRFQLPAGLEFISQDANSGSQSDYKRIDFNHSSNGRFLPGGANMQTTMITSPSSTSHLATSNFQPHQ